MKCGKQSEKVRKEMKKLILILLLLTPVWAFTQTHTFTDKEVVKMASLIQVYEQNDSLQKIKIKLLIHKPIVEMNQASYKFINNHRSLHKIL